MTIDGLGLNDLILIFIIVLFGKRGALSYICAPLPHNPFMVIVMLHQMLCNSVTLFMAKHLVYFSVNTPWQL